MPVKMTFRAPPIQPSPEELAHAAVIGVLKKYGKKAAMAYPDLLDAKGQGPGAWKAMLDKHGVLGTMSACRAVRQLLEDVDKAMKDAHAG